VYLLYSFLTAVVFVLASPYFLYQALRHNKYVGSIAQRLGYLPVAFNLDGDESIWVHAVSVGEVLSARPLISELRASYPKLRLFLSTTTMTGQQIARNNLQLVRMSKYCQSVDAFDGKPRSLFHSTDEDLYEMESGS